MFRIIFGVVRLEGVSALDFTERLGLTPRQEVYLGHAGRDVEVPDWFIRAHAPSGSLQAEIHPDWVMPGEVTLDETQTLRLKPLSPERITQLMIAYLHSVQEQRIRRLEAAITEAIEGLLGTRDQFESAAIADIRRGLERALQSPEEGDEEDRN